VNLVSLSLQNTNKVDLATLHVIAGLPKLRRLDLSNALVQAPLVKEDGVCPSLAQLEWLNLYDNPCLRDRDFDQMMSLSGTQECNLKHLQIRLSGPMLTVLSSRSQKLLSIVGNLRGDFDVDALSAVIHSLKYVVLLCDDIGRAREFSNALYRCPNLLYLQTNCLYAPTSETIKWQSVGLQTLLLVAGPTRTGLFDIILQCPSLTKLSLRLIGDNEMLCCLARAPNSLQVLDVSESAVTGLGLGVLLGPAGHSKLSTINISSLNHLHYLDIELLIRLHPDVVFHVNDEVTIGWPFDTWSTVI